LIATSVGFAGDAETTTYQTSPESSGRDWTKRAVVTGSKETCQTACNPNCGLTRVEVEKVRQWLQWHIAARPTDIARMPESRAKTKVQKQEHGKASIRAKVEHPFRVIKRQFGLMKVRFKGLQKNTAHVVTLFALSNLWMARRQLIAMLRAVRPKAA